MKKALLSLALLSVMGSAAATTYTCGDQILSGDLATGEQKVIAKVITQNAQGWMHSGLADGTNGTYVANKDLNHSGDNFSDEYVFTINVTETDGVKSFTIKNHEGYYVPNSTSSSTATKYYNSVTDETNAGTFKMDNCITTSGYTDWYMLTATYTSSRLDIHFESDDAHHLTFFSTGSGGQTDAGGMAGNGNATRTAAAVMFYKAVESAATEVSVKFNFKLGDTTYSVTKTGYEGDKAVDLISGVIPAHLGYTVTGIEGQEADFVLTSDAEQEYTVAGTWAYFNKVGRVRFSTAGTAQRWWKYDASSDYTFLTKDATDLDAFVPERLFIMNAEFSGTDGTVLVSFQNVKAGADLYMSVPSAANSNNAVMSETATKWIAVSSNASGRFALRHQDNAQAHMNNNGNNGNGIGHWVSAWSQDDANGVIYFQDITDTDWALTEWSPAAGTTYTLDSDKMAAAKADPTLANFISLFELPASAEALISYNAIVAKGNYLRNNSNVSALLDTDSWDAAAQTLTSATDEDVTNIQAAYNALAAGNAGVHFTAANQFSETATEVYLGSDTAKGEAGRVASGHQAVYTIKAATDGCYLFSEYAQKYLQMDKTNDNDACLLVADAAEATIWQFDAYSETALPGIKAVGGDYDSGAALYLNTNANLDHVTRWDYNADCKGSQWVLAVVDDLAAAKSHLAGLDITDGWGDHSLVGTGIGQYTFSDADGVTADLQGMEDDRTTYLESGTLDNINTLINDIETYVALATLNQPEVGKFYRFRNYQGENYMGSTVTSDKRIPMQAEAGGAETIFYLAEGNVLVSYKTGYVLGKFAGSADRCLLLSTDTNASAGVTFSEGTTKGQYFINTYCSGTKDFYIFNAVDAGGNVDRGSFDTGGKPVVGNPGNYYGYNWTLEEVTELPYTLGENGNGTVYFPVAMNIPTGLNAYTLHENKSAATELVKKAVTGNLAAATAYFVEGETGDYTFTAYTAPASSDDEGSSEGAGTDRIVETETANALSGSHLAFTVGTDSKYYTHSNTTFAYNEGTTEIAGFTAHVAKAADTEANTLEVKDEATATPTGISEINAAAEGAATIYDLMGRRLAAPARGINIINGRKVLVK